MSITDNLKAAVEARDLSRVRNCLWSAIMFDKSMTGSFKESLGYVLAGGIAKDELFEPDDGEAFDETPAKENYSKLGGMLRVNFSERKLEALKRMGRALSSPEESSSPRIDEPAAREVPTPGGRDREEGSPAKPLLAAAAFAAAALACGIVLWKILR